MNDPAEALPEAAPEAPTAPEEPAPLAPEPPPSLAPVLAQISERLARLERKFDEKIRADASREAVVDRLHAEVQEHRTDLLLKVLRPVLLDLVALHDDISRSLSAAGTPETELERKLLRALEGVQQDVADILTRQGAESDTAEGPVFDPRRQRASRTLVAPDPEHAGLIAERLRPGWRVGERVLRPELVTVYVRPPAQGPAAPADSLGGPSI